MATITKIYFLDVSYKKYQYFYDFFLKMPVKLLPNQ